MKTLEELALTDILHPEAITPEITIDVFLLQVKEPPYAGLINFWHHHEGTEVMLALCPRCEHPLPEDYPTYAQPAGLFTDCPHCKQSFPDLEVITEKRFRLGLAKLAAELITMLQRMEYNATIRLHRHKSEITLRKAIETYSDTTRIAPKLMEARSGKVQEWVEYSGKRIQQDLSNGADPVRTLHKFLKV